MALLNSSHRFSTAGAQRASKREIHPSVCLVAGFGFIVAAALLVHVGFSVLF